MSLNIQPFSVIASQKEKYLQEKLAVDRKDRRNAADSISQKQKWQPHQDSNLN